MCLDLDVFSSVEQIEISRKGANLFERLIREQYKNLLIMVGSYIIKEWNITLIIINFSNSPFNIFIFLYIYEN